MAKVDRRDRPTPTRASRERDVPSPTSDNDTMVVLWKIGQRIANAMTDEEFAEAVANGTIVAERLPGPVPFNESTPVEEEEIDLTDLSPQVIRIMESLGEIPPQD